MTGSQIEQPQTDSQRKAEAKHKRAYRLLMAGGVFNIISGILQQLINSSADLPPFIFHMTILAGVMVLGSGYLLFKRRMLLGVVVLLLSAPPILLYLISVNSGIGVLVTVATMLLFLIILPLILTDSRMIIQTQVGTVVGSVLIVIADLFWPFARQEVDTGFLYTSVAILVVLLGVFGYYILRQFPEYGIRGKLITTTLVVAVVAVALVAFGVNNFTRNALIEKAGVQLDTLVDSQAVLVGELFYRELAALQALSLSNSLLSRLAERNASYADTEAAIAAQMQVLDASWQDAATNSPMVTAVLGSPLSEELRQFRASFPENSTFIVADQYGALLATTEKTEQYDLTNTRWWQDSNAFGFGTVAFGDPFVNSLNGQSYIEISMPLYTRLETGGKQFAGLLYAAYSLSALEDLLVETQYGETGETRLHLPGYEMVIDENDKLLILEEQTLSSDSEFATFLDPQATFAFIEQGSETVLAAGELVNTQNHQPIIDDLNWLITVQQAEQEALAAVQEQQRLNILLGLLVLIATGGAAAVVGRLLTEPIVQLTAVAEKVTAGDLTAQAEIQAKDEIGTLATALNSMTAQVRGAINTLETRVQERTRALEISIEVGRRLSTILDSQQLVEAVVNQIRDAFNYYHVHIYLLDDEDPTILRMVGGTGSAGQQMLAQNHQLQVGQGLVGQAAATLTAVWVPDVAQNLGWLPNALLPDTKAEIAVPIVSGKELMGVLDVQHNEKDGLSQTDVGLIELIAGQVAVALRNAHLYQSVQERANRELQINEINQKIMGTTDVQLAMQVAVRELGQALGVSKATVRMISTNGQEGLK